MPKLFPSDMVVVTELKAGDVVLSNHDITEIWTAIEFKTINELLSCIVTGRFAGTQLPAMDQAYSDYWLLVEGPFKRGPGGELMVEGGGGRWYQARVGTRYFDKSDLDRWVITMTTKTPLKIHFTQSRQETREWINTMHWWWENKDKHQSHVKMDKSRDRVELIKPTLVRGWAEWCPGIGHEKAIRASRAFGTGFDLAVAGEDEWMRIEGVGRTMAERIVGRIRNGEG